MSLKIDFSSYQGKGGGSGQNVSIDYAVVLDFSLYFVACFHGDVLDVSVLYGTRVTRVTMVILIIFSNIRCHKQGMQIKPRYTGVC